MEEQITKRRDLFSSPIDILSINKEDFPWHFNLSANNLNQPTEDPLRTLVLYDSDYKTSKTRSLQWKKKNVFEGYVLNSTTSLALVESRLSQREIFLDKDASELYK